MSVLCIVPTPVRATRAARRLCDAQGGLLLGARVATIDAVAARVLAAGDARPVLSPLAERLASLDAAAGWPGLERDGGLARSLASAIAELRRAEVAVADLRAGAAELGGRRGERLSQLADVLEAHEARLGALGALDAAAALRAASGKIDAGGGAAVLREFALLVVEGFHTLSPAAFALVSALAHRTRRTHVRVPYFADRPDLCTPGEPLLRAVEGLHPLAARNDVEVVLERADDRAPRIARLLRSVLGGAAAAPVDGGAGVIVAASGAGEHGEAAAAAAVAARFVEQGLAPEEIVLIGTGAAPDAETLSRAFASAGVPFAGGRGRALGAEPLVRAVLGALAAAVRPDRATLEAVLSSSYLSLTRPPPRLGVWLDRAGAVDGRGAAADVLRRRAAGLTAPSAAPERAALLRAAGAIDAASEALRPLGAAGLPREHAARLRGFLSSCGTRRRAARGDAEIARRDLASLTRLDEVADDLVRALGLLGRGGTPIAAERWVDLLALAIDAASSPPAPEPAAGAVELWSLADAPGISARAAILVGCSRGAFPARPAPDVLLGDTERAAVNRAAGRAALASGATRRAEARHSSFCALAAGREALAITWAGPGPEGASSGPSPLALEALALAGLDANAVPAWQPPAPAPATDGAGRSALERGAIEHERRESVAARHASRFAGAISPALLDDLGRALPDEWTPSQLENHARCPFRFFAASVLRLSEPDAGDVDIDPRDEGSLAHAVLERFLRARLAAGSLPLAGTPDEREHLDGVASDLFARFEADGRTGDAAVWAARRGAVLRRLERVVASEAAAGDGTVPALLEHGFGGDSGNPPLVFPDGDGEVRVRGRIDRVDADPERLVVIDYKDSRASASWRKKLAAEALGDVSFQVPAYLMAAARALPGRARLEATYLLLRAAERVPPFATTPGDALFAVDEPARAAARAAGARPFADAVISAVRRIRAGDLPIASRDCGGCPFGAVCRSQSSAEEEVAA